MRNIAIIVILTITFNASHEGFVGTRAEQEDYVTEALASTEEYLYSDSTSSSPTTQAATEVVIE